MGRKNATYVYMVLVVMVVVFSFSISVRLNFCFAEAISCGHLSLGTGVAELQQCFDSSIYIRYHYCLPSTAHPASQLTVESFDKARVIIEYGVREGVTLPELQRRLAELEDCFLQARPAVVNPEDFLGQATFGERLCRIWLVP